MEEEVNTESIADTLTAVLAETESETEAEEVEVVSQEEATEEVEVEAEAETETEEDSEDSEEPTEVFQAPEHWSSDEREQFDALSPEAQEILLSRDKAFQTGYQEKAQAISAITDALEPWKDALAQRGVTADQAIRSLFAAQHALDTNPIEGILQIAQSYGMVDQLRNKFAPETDDNDFTDPEVKALRQEISDLKGRLDQTTKGIEQQGTSAVQQQIDTFANAVDGDGNKQHPYFDQVRLQMAPLVNSGKSLEEAYKEVVWTVPEYRESQIQAKEAEKQEKTDAEKAAKVKKAKRAARGVKPNGKANLSDESESLTLGDELRAAYSQHSS